MNIAICDDMPFFIENTENYIKEYENTYHVKFDIFKYLSGEDLINKFNENQKLFDLIFLDQYMNKLTGVETATHIRRYNTDCPIVFVTSENNHSVFQETKPMKILLKPVTKEQIFSVLDSIHLPMSTR